MPVAADIGLHPVLGEAGGADKARPAVALGCGGDRLVLGGELAIDLNACARR